MASAFPRAWSRRKENGQESRPSGRMSLQSKFSSRRIDGRWCHVTQATIFGDEWTSDSGSREWGFIVLLNSETSHAAHGSSDKPRTRYGPPCLHRFDITGKPVGEPSELAHRLGLYAADGTCPPQATVDAPPRHGACVGRSRPPAGLSPLRRNASHSSLRSGRCTERRHPKPLLQLGKRSPGLIRHLQGVVGRRWPARVSVDR